MAISERIQTSGAARKIAASLEAWREPCVTSGIPSNTVIVPTRRAPVAYGAGSDVADEFTAYVRK